MCDFNHRMQGALAKWKQTPRMFMCACVGSVTFDTPVVQTNVLWALRLLQLSREHLACCGPLRIDCDYRSWTSFPIDIDVHARFPRHLSRIGGELSISESLSVLRGLAPPRYVCADEDRRCCVALCDAVGAGEDPCARVHVPELVPMSRWDVSLRQCWIRW